jgi:hypothetical protein
MDKARYRASQIEGGHWIGRLPSGTGLRLSLGGCAGLTLGWVEGIEFNLLGAVAGLDLRRPALKLPGLGRVGYPEAAAFFDGVQRKLPRYAFIAAAFRRSRQGLRCRMRAIPARIGHRSSEQGLIRCTPRRELQKIGH